MRPVDDGDGGAHADRNCRGVRARDAAAENEHVGGGHSGNAAKQHAAPALPLLERVRADLRRQPAGDFRHRRQQRQTALRVGHGFVGDVRRAGGDQVLRLRQIGGEMQIGEQNLPAMQLLPLLGQRFLDFDDHFSPGENLRRRVNELGAGASVFLIRGTGSDARAPFDDHAVPMINKFRDRRRRHSDAEFVVLDLLGNADKHE